MGLMKTYKTLLESLPAKTVVFAFGRFNPPTSGHQLLVEFVKRLAGAKRADHVIYASRSQDSKKNPLSIERKLHYLKLMFPNVNFVGASPEARTFLEAVEQLNKRYKHLVMVAGSDRVPEYTALLQKYNGTLYNYDSIVVESAGERDPDADDASGMSASKMRALATKGQFHDVKNDRGQIVSRGFKSGLPSSIRDIDGRRLMNDVREGMGLVPIKEQLTIPTSTLREQYYKGEIYQIGDIVETLTGEQLEIIKRGTNHLLCKDAEGKLTSRWLHDVC